MLWILITIFAAAALAPALHRLVGARCGAVLSLVLVGAWFWFWWATYRLPGGHMESYPWLPSLGIELAFVTDGLSKLFGMLVLGIGVAVLVYSTAYMKGSDRLGSFFARMLFFTGSMLGLVIADGLATLYVFWEMTTIASFFLIGWQPEKAAVRDAAHKALIVTAMGGLALLAALVTMAITAGPPAGGQTVALSISHLNEVGLQEHNTYPIIVVLVVFAAVAKSAQAPLWFWLPAAMKAPTPVSAYLHSATMVKAGVFLLARFSPALGDTPLWTLLLTTIGGATMVAAGLGALAQSDLKRLLAFSTISVLGAIIYLLGMGSEDAVAAAIVLVVAHALYKAALFLVAGTIEKASGSRELHELGGLARGLPGTAATAVIAAASLAALPPFLGYVAKEKLYAAALTNLGMVGLAIAVVGGLAMVAAALLVAVLPFFGPRRAPNDQLRHVPAAMTLPPFALAAVGLVATFLPGPLRGWMSEATQAVAVGHHEVELSLWPGTDAKGLTVLAATAITYGAGVLLYLLRSRRAVSVLVGLGDRALEGTAEFAERVGSAAMAGAKALTLLHQTGRVGSYLRTIFVATVVAAAVPLSIDLMPRTGEIGITWFEAAILTLIVAGALGAVILPRSLSAVASLGAAGLGIALLFAVFSAPDLAITQVMVEALIVVIFVLTFYRLRSAEAPETPIGRASDIGLSVALGTVMTLLVLSAATLPSDPSVARAISEASVPIAQGRNVVNVILVEVRAFDTLGEVTVLGTAALGAVALLRRRERS